MAINPAQVAGRRSVHYDRPEDILAEAEKLAEGQVRTLGNWTFPQILGHLARTFDAALDGPPFRTPWYLSWLGPCLKNRFLTKAMSPGFRLPQAAVDKLVPRGNLSLEDGLAQLRDSLARYCREPQRAPHGFFGKLTPEEWDQFLCRHAEMHMSFVERA